MTDVSTMAATPGSTSARRPMTREERKVIFASSLGTVFEWYDFYLYGSLATIIGDQFFKGVNETTAFIFALLAFAAGFLVRPFGALVFGRLGDLVGRKYTFLVTILIMGLSTAVVGFLPGYAVIGVAAPVILVALRLLQGLALGGEYGGAATYVAEHAPNGRRGEYTSYIQITATAGLFLSLLVIYACRNILGKDVFADWGWRVPFIVSLALLGISVYIRMKLSESPAFTKMKAEGKHSKAPLKESFGDPQNLWLVVRSLIGGTAGQAVVWYTGQFFVLFFLEKMLKLDKNTTDLLTALALLIGTPCFVLFGWLSDRIGRKPIVMAGCLIAALTYFPIFKSLTGAVNPAFQKAVETAPVTVVASESTCSFQFDPLGKAKFTSSCDIAKGYLAKKGIPYANAHQDSGVSQIKIGSVVIPSYEGAGLSKEEAKAKKDEFEAAIGKALTEAGYPKEADLKQVDKPKAIALLTLLIIYVTMVYGPIAAWLVELFPTRIRYSSMSLPYHIGNGWFGGLLPTFAFAMVAATGDIYYGLWYPVVIALITFVAGTLLLPETKDRGID